jgi:hypothetical protein
MRRKIQGFFVLQNRCCPLNGNADAKKKNREAAPGS